ncbi:protein NRT1/ PTR FAMILY 5.10-like [Coffea eugenioides]|uniref:protein NRT1/ PTR FAMILY 5.10-like n=1 Tax=Coffea eugenioides TaxID=49369 RepID=UPI000F614A4C|nr:protein NRT1/ PTR FAMILY 5.10-like [Coffea eugenioides]
MASTDPIGLAIIPADIPSSDEEVSACHHDTIDGVVDYQGLPAKRSQSGKWKSAYFIIGVGVAERFAYFGVGSNLITYLTGHLRQSTAVAAANVNLWTGAGAMLPLVGAFVADSFLGRYRTIVVASVIYILALGLLTISAMLNCQSNISMQSCSPSQLQVILFFFSLYLIALSQGAHKPCIVAFGADQFDGQDSEESRSKSSFFNWWYFGLCAGPLSALLVLNYIQDNLSWALGFGIPCSSLAVALLVFLLGTKTYRYKVKDEEKFSVSNIGNLFAKGAKYRQSVPSSKSSEGVHATVNEARSKQYEFLNEALLEKDDLEKYKDVSEVCEFEELKSLKDLFPIWATSLAYAVVFAQTSTLFTEQGVTMDKSIGSGFVLPAASLQYLTGISIILFVPIYDRIFVPLARTITGRPSGITKLQRIGIGMVLCTDSMIIAALVERKRLQIAQWNGLAGLPHATVPMSFWWLVPQYILFGIADVFTVVGLQELFYDQMPSELKTIGLSFFLSIFRIGSFLSSFLISSIERFTSTGSRVGGWFSSNLNLAHLDYFYWLLAGFSMVEFLAFLYHANSYAYNGQGRSTA